MADNRWFPILLESVGNHLKILKVAGEEEAVSIFQLSYSLQRSDLKH